MRRWSRRRKAYSGAGSSCPNGRLLTLVTSGAKYRLGSNVHRAVFDSQDRMCCSMDRQMDIAPVQMLLLGQGALLGCFTRCHHSHGHPATGQPSLWIWLQGEMWGWSGFGHISCKCLLAGLPKVIGVVVRGWDQESKKLQGIVKYFKYLNILPWPSSVSILHPSSPPSILSSSTFVLFRI